MSVAVVFGLVGCGGPAHGPDRVGAAAAEAIRIITLRDLCWERCDLVRVDTTVRSVPVLLGSPLERAPFAGRLWIHGVDSTGLGGATLVPTQYPGGPGDWFLTTFVVAGDSSDSTTVTVGILVRHPDGSRRVWHLTLTWSSGRWTGKREDAAYYP